MLWPLFPYFLTLSVGHLYQDNSLRREYAQASCARQQPDRGTSPRHTGMLQSSTGLLLCLNQSDTPLFVQDQDKIISARLLLGYLIGGRLVGPGRGGGLEQLITATLSPGVCLPSRKGKRLCVDVWVGEPVSSLTGSDEAITVNYLRYPHQQPYAHYIPRNHISSSPGVSGCL